MTDLLIIGGSGFLGSALIQAALGRGHDVGATFHAAPLTHDARWMQLDLRDEAAIGALVAAIRPRCIINTAYMQSGPDLVQITGRAPGAIGRSAAEVGARLIQLSSDVIFDGERAGSYIERDAPSPISAYGEAKALAETLVIAAHPAAAIVRTSLIYDGTSPSKHEQFVLQTLDAEANVTFYDDELRCPIQVNDLADALLELCRLDPAGPINIAGPEVVSRARFAQLVARRYGRDPARVQSGPSPRGTSRPRNCALDTMLARTMLASTPRAVSDVLRAQ